MLCLINGDIGVRKNTGRIVLTAFLCFSLAFPTLMLVSDRVAADSWSDDFTDTGTDFNARWVEGGVGDTIPDGTTYAVAYTFDDDLIDPATLPLWYGPTLRSEISLSGDFDVLATLDCIADIADYNVGKMEIRLLDSSENIVYHDLTSSTQILGMSNSSVIKSTASLETKPSRF